MRKRDSVDEAPDPWQAKEALERALFEIRRVIAGQDVMLERVLVCLLTGGHLLIEGVPGLAKTLTVKTTAARARRLVQARPVHARPRAVRPRRHAHLPPRPREFDTELGPVFCNFLLADEINRAPAKVQSALLEVMQERQVTIGHETHSVPDPFLVMATQNPIESEGTYPLPEAQVDRFMLKILVDYPPHDEELTVVHRSLAPAPSCARCSSLEELRALQATVDRRLRRSGARHATRSRWRPPRANPAERRPGRPGAATSRSAPARAARSASMHAARALAVVRGRDYVLPQDVDELAQDALRHRLVLSYEALAEERSPRRDRSTR